MMSDNWFEVVRIDDSTYAITEPGHWERCISYLVLGSSSAALIDTGLGIANIRRITDSLTELPIKVLTTHVHWDHIGGHGLYAEIYVHAGDLDWLVHGLPTPIAAIRAGLMRDPLTRPTPPEFDPAAYVPFTGQPTGLLTDGQVIELGDRKLCVFSTPGHSPGHLCFLDPDRGYLFTGDLLYQGTLYAFYPSTDPMAYAVSIARMNGLCGITRLLPGHNQLEVDVGLLGLADDAFQRLKAQGELHHGSGVHDFGQLKIKL